MDVFWFSTLHLSLGDVFLCVSMLKSLNPFPPMTFIECRDNKSWLYSNLTKRDATFLVSKKSRLFNSLYVGALKDLSLCLHISFLAAVSPAKGLTLHLILLLSLFEVRTDNCQWDANPGNPHTPSAPWRVSAGILGDRQHGSLPTGSDSGALSSLEHWDHKIPRELQELFIMRQQPWIKSYPDVNNKGLLWGCLLMSKLVYNVLPVPFPFPPVSNTVPCLSMLVCVHTSVQ